MPDPVRVFYFSPWDIFKPRTNQIAAIHMCEGLAENGCDVTFIAPAVHRKTNPPKEAILDCYGVVRKFEVARLPTPFVTHSNGWTRRLIVIALDIVHYARLARRRGGLRVAISNSETVLWPMAVLRKRLGWGRSCRIIPWLHELKLTRAKAWLLKNADGILCTNSAIKEDLVRKLGIDPGRIFVTLNPVSEEQRRNPMTKAAARKRIGYDLDRPLVVYSGKMFPGQIELGRIIDAAAALPECSFIFTGGRPDVVEHYAKLCERKGIGNCRFVEYSHDHADVRPFQFAADVLVSYYSPQEHVVRYNLPNKVCEYMLTGNPIVIPDFPATRDVLNADNAVFVEPENPAALAEAIRTVIRNYPEYVRRAQRALRDVQDLTYRKRAGLIRDFMMTTVPHPPGRPPGQAAAGSGGGGRA